MHKHYVIFDKTVTKPVFFWEKFLFPYLNPTSYLSLLNQNKMLLEK